VRRPFPPVGAWAEALCAGDRAALARAITLVESTLPAHQDLAAELLGRVLPRTGRARRVGVTGVPGVGKSTFIEALGMELLGAGHRVAVLAVDPSSARTGGSILGDKTRMARLSMADGAFVRPSPAGGTLGGVAARTREALLLCEAAGYDVVLVETVGVGQSETVVAGMTDTFLVLLLAGAGDELQGIKRGIMELADVLTVQKADGSNRLPAARAAQAVQAAVDTLHARAEWRPPVLTCSAVEGTGVSAVWEAVEAHRAAQQATGALGRRREAQARRWMEDLIEDGLRDAFHGDPAVAAAWPATAAAVAAGTLAPTAAARQLLRVFSAARGEPRAPAR
jgi:LAO/AO transport system kinase